MLPSQAPRLADNLQFRIEFIISLTGQRVSQTIPDIEALQFHSSGSGCGGDGEGVGDDHRLEVNSVRSCKYEKDFLGLLETLST